VKYCVNQRRLFTALFGFALLSSTAWQVQPAKAQTASAEQDQAAQAAPSPEKTLKPVVMKPATRKPVAPKLASVSTSSADVPAADSAAGGEGAKAQKRTTRRVSSSAAIKGPYYVDFRSRTAASYGHAFVWFGKSTDKKVDVAGLHPAGDEVPFILGHVVFVPAETGASYGDLDPEYLTASYRVYMSEADAKRVFAYIRKLQSTTKLWNEMSSNCTSFMGQIATFMGLKTPFFLMYPEEYVNKLKEMNDDKQFITLPPQSAFAEQ